jgi:hypothetical protein
MDYPTLQENKCLESRVSTHNHTGRFKVSRFQEIRSYLKARVNCKERVPYFKDITIQ